MQFDFKWNFHQTTGRRHCPGETLAKTEIFILLANILQHFQVSMADSDKPVDLSAGKFGVTYAPPDFKLKLKPIDKVAC